MVVIHNVHDLIERIEEYKRMFPESHTSMDMIKSILSDPKYEYAPPGLIFGVSVSPEWEDKCYGFEVEKQTPTTVYFRFLGMWKC